MLFEFLEIAEKRISCAPLKCQGVDFSLINMLCRVSLFTWTWSFLQGESVSLSPAKGNETNQPLKLWVICTKTKRTNILVWFV